MFFVLFFLLSVSTAYTRYPIDSNHLDLNNYAYYRQAFTESEINRIRLLINKDSFQTATLPNQCAQKPPIRDSEVQWIEDSPETQWLYQKILRLAKQANDAMYNFHLTHINNAIQFTRYKKGGSYDWHIDLGPGVTAFRKLSMVMLLSDPLEFEGGALELRLGNTLETAPLNHRGSVVFFPSYILHRVLPVITGTRESLVVWISGYPFH
tara:strand:+ start:473 stop:1099 length:627 start_codon:yes stop_codon:yes gene_type:complete